MEKTKDGYLKIPKGTHWRTIANMPYLNGSQLNGEEVVEVVGFKEESFYSKKEKATVVELVMYVSGHKEGIILNTRKYKAMEKLFGTNIDTWAGNTITIFAKEEKHFGEYFPVINIKAGEITKETLNSKHKNWEAAKKSIEQGKTTVQAIEKHYKLSASVKKTLEDLVPGE